MGKVLSIIIPLSTKRVNAVHTVTNLLQQDYPDLEIIFVDDGSDATYEKVRRAFAAEPRVRGDQTQWWQGFGPEFLVSAFATNPCPGMH